ncbi:hypothetical protein L6452_11390 [Arctium lappa]|uniref:Uncharacterized protein n=1 Tax=Arctium lappa TaxID=4217 RepID=A0ACB9DPH6_ARCLA|nr:hypothetical protein L6452_11390 [Arctium lappa]
MTNSIMFSLLLLFAFFILTPPVTAEIRTLKIKDDNRPVILFEKFGFTHNGFASVAVSSVSVTSSLSQPDPSFLGFFLVAESSRNQVLMELEQKPETCVVASKFVSLLFTFQDLAPPPHSSLNKSFPVNYPDEYYLFFANCNRQSLVSMNVRTELYNSDDGNHKDYLSAGQTQLPSFYFIFSMIYMCFVGLWTAECLKNKGSVHRIHLLMGVLLVVKALNLICEAEAKHYVKVTGTPHGWDVLFYTFQFFRAVLLFTVIVLIGTGWSFLKPFLQEKEKKVLMIVIPLQVLANIAAIVVGETGPFSKSWVTWNQVFMTVDLLCCFAILFPIVWSIRSLRETSKTDGKAARNLAKLTLFRKFYMLVMGYLYFTRIIVFSLETISSYKFEWVSNGAQEVGSLVFYVMMFNMFRPVENNEYFLIDDEEEKAAERALHEEEFEL